MRPNMGTATKSTIPRVATHAAAEPPRCLIMLPAGCVEPFFGPGLAIAGHGVGIDHHRLCRLDQLVERCRQWFRRLARRPHPIGRRDDVLEPGPHHERDETACQRESGRALDESGDLDLYIMAL